MASQQAVQSREQQDTISVPLLQPREASNSRNSTQPQPLLADQSLIDIDESLLNAYLMIDGVRKDLHGYKTTLGDTTKRCLVWEQVYYEENQNRVACAKAYAELYDKYEATINDLHAMSSRCLSFHRDLEHAQTAILALESTIQEKERSSVNWDMLQQGIANEQLEARIRELENENCKMLQEHDNAMIEKANRIYVDQREADDVAKMSQTASPGKVRPSMQGRRVKRSRKVKQEPEPYSP